jgi:hypothetical protein
MYTSTIFWLQKPEGKRELRIPRRKWEDNIGMDLRKMGWGGMDWMHLAQDSEQLGAVVNTVLNIWIP